MQLEEGKYYKTQSGRKIGPMVPKPNSLGQFYRWTDGVHNWSHTGRFFPDFESGMDIIEEWIDPDLIVEKPVRFHDDITPQEWKEKIAKTWDIYKIY